MAQSRSRKVGVVALLVALFGLLALTFFPTPYVIQQPGPVYNTLGTTGMEGEEVPLIAIDGAETYPAEGALDLTTVQVVGNRERTPSWLELALAWADASRAVVPIEAVFPEGVTEEQRDEQNATLMTDSQQEATAAALIELGYDIYADIRVAEVLEDGAANGVLQQDDHLISVDGERIRDANLLRARVQEKAGEPVTLTVDRDGAEQDIVVTPTRQEETAESPWLIGVSLSQTFDFPLDVTIQLDNVGGPSAGMMFALGIVDTLTPGDLTGGAQVAGTGTIDAAGTVGPIGGIRQKLYGARDAGAEYFLAPAANCTEVTGHIPDGLRVFRTETLSQSLQVLETIAQDGDLDDLPTCDAAAQASPTAESSTDSAERQPLRMDL